MTDGGDDSTRRKPDDVVLLGPPTPDGGGLHVLRAREHRIEAGELRALQEGRPVTGEIVTLAPREDKPWVCDVKESVKVPGPTGDAAPKKGPAQVATSVYRERWDEIFGARPDPKSLN